MAGTETYPRLFGKYVLVAPLARGGMGELHLALSGQADLRKLCVIKQIIRHLADKDFVRRFVDEAKLMVKLSHGNLVPVFESGVVDGQYFLVMEYIEGKDLRAVWNALQRLKQRCPLDVTLHIVKEICRGLSYAHNYRDLALVHRDISPPNVLLSYSGEVRITDFGLAYSRLKVQKTSPGVLFGKLAYMAPEQARNEKVDARTDIYSVGVILWELATNRRMHVKKGTQLEQLRRAANPEFEAPSKIDTSLPPALDLIARRALAPKREDRYPDAESMRKDIAGFLAKLAPTTDASSVERFLRDLFGNVIDRDLNERQLLLETMAPQVQRLLEHDEIATEEVRAIDEIESDEHEIESGDIIGVDGEPRLRAVQAGTMLGERYRIEDKIREGGMGTVYLATHTGIDKQVAVKILHPLYSTMPEVVRRFRQEAKAASRIGHPNIIEIFDSGTTEDGSIYFAMEHLTGHDLADLLEHEGPLAPDRALRIAAQICQAVGAAHEAEIIHRDLKPENIFLVAKKGEVDFVKVLDFGIAQSAQLEESRKERLTNPGMAMGTPEYMAPEQAAGKGCDARADVYAVGAILYEMLTGRPPHAGENMLEILNRKANEPVTPLRELRPDVHAELARVVHWTLATDPDERPQSMSHLGYELDKLRRGRPGAVASMLGLADLSEPEPPPSTAKPVAEEEYEPASGEFDVHANTAVLGPRTSAGLRPWAWLAAVALVAVGAAVGALLLREDRKVLANATDDASSRPAVPDVGGGGPSARLPAHRDAATAHDAAKVAALPARPDAARTAPRPKRADVRPKPRHHPRSGGRRLRAGLRHLKAGRFTRARAAFQAARRDPRVRGRALIGLAKVEFQLNNFHAARAFAKVSLSHGSGWRAYLVLGNINYKLGQFAEAQRMYKRVLKRAAHNREARRNLEATRAKLRRKRKGSRRSR